ncbi:carbonate dehydratase [bacterium]|nr:carbonate dehydratase [bacterium]
MKNIFKQNRKWAEDIKNEDPEFFEKLSKQQNPEYLWIGCSDSRVPANEISGLMPGDVFVHRNIANLVVHTDFNCLSVIQYAVDVLQVKHIIVCGHYGCGGIKAAMESKQHGLIDNWLRHVKDIYSKYQADLDKLESDDEKYRLLCELNVKEQVNNVCSTTMAQNAWERGQDLTVHGWVYSLTDGILHDLNVSVSC